MDSGTSYSSRRRGRGKSGMLRNRRARGRPPSVMERLVNQYVVEIQASPDAVQSVTAAGVRYRMIKVSALRSACRLREEMRFRCRRARSATKSMADPCLHLLGNYSHDSSAHWTDNRTLACVTCGNCASRVGRFSSRPGRYATSVD